MIEIKKTDETNLFEDSFDDFERLQVVTNVYGLADGKLILVGDPFVMDWPLERKREEAREIMNGKYIAYCAYEGDTVVGVLELVPELNKERLVIEGIHVSKDYRHQGIGRKLFELAVEKAHEMDAKSLYASACPAEETVDFYLAMGFTVSDDPIAIYRENEPLDIQMECKL